ncbi:acyltransferase family protein [Thaumasiovibrio subtropicus]|uniref:acyltransferase family protein n=1 Tax=Thaumasiovibrio subtropicus TaxID=1891207 RepID=UPI000B359FA4|nr:acyltransferase family protein [Thaumasiovibrio subtropicus]
MRSVLLDMLRLIAIALVFIAHFGQLFEHEIGAFFGIKNVYYVSLGGVGVTLFLILSGLLAGLTDAKRFIEPKDQTVSFSSKKYYQYVIKKLLRIYPVYWVSVILSIIGYGLSGVVLKERLLPLFPNGVLTDLFGSTTGFYAWFGLWGGPFNPPSWFIALIIPLYLLFPLLQYLLWRWKWVALLTLLCVSIVSRIWVGQHGVVLLGTSLFNDIEAWVYRLYGFMPGRPGDWFVLCRVFEFSLGIFLAYRVPKAVWFKLQLGRLNQPIARLSDLAFPLFLLHVPFLFFPEWLSLQGLQPWLAIVVFMMLLLPLAWGVSCLDAVFPRRTVTRWLSGEV